MPPQRIRVHIRLHDRDPSRCPLPSLRRKEVTWLVKKRHPKQKLRRLVLTAERKWSLSVSHQFCSVGNSRISRSNVRSAVLRKHSGSSAVDDQPHFGMRSQNGDVVASDFVEWIPAVAGWVAFSGAVFAVARRNRTYAFVYPMRRHLLGGAAFFWCAGVEVSEHDRANTQAQTIQWMDPMEFVTAISDPVTGRVRTRYIAAGLSPPTGLTAFRSSAMAYSKLGHSTGGRHSHSRDRSRHSRSSRRAAWRRNGKSRLAKHAGELLRISMQPNDATCVSPLGASRLALATGFLWRRWVAERSADAGAALDGSEAKFSFPRCRVSAKCPLAFRFGRDRA
jgi:hypothetical protein